jgi:hypothetical protein
MNDSIFPIINRGQLEPPRVDGGWEERLKDNPNKNNPKICQENQNLFNFSGKWTNKCSEVVASPSLMHSSILNGALLKERENLFSLEKSVEHNWKNDQAADIPEFINEDLLDEEGKNFYLKLPEMGNMKSKTSVIRDKTRTFVGDYVVSIDVNFDQDNWLYAVVTDDGFFRNKRSRRLLSESSGNPENQILIENQDLQDEFTLPLTEFKNFQKDTVIELNSIKNNKTYNLIGIKLSIQKFQENSVMNLQFLIDTTQMNQNICKETQSLIINNHTQLIEKFTVISTLVQGL